MKKLIQALILSALTLAGTSCVASPKPAPVPAVDECKALKAACAKAGYAATAGNVNQCVHALVTVTAPAKGSPALPHVNPEAVAKCHKQLGL